MITEVRTEIVPHPVNGGLEKQFAYTYDETKYASLQLAIEAFNNTNGKDGYVQKEFYVPKEKVDMSTLDFKKLSEQQKADLRTAIGVAPQTPNVNLI